MSRLRPQASFATAFLLSAILFVSFAWPAIRSTTTRLPAARLAASSTGILGPGQRLTAGHAVVSASGQYRLAMQGDGNLVEYTAGRALWSTGSWGHPGAWAVMQGDGNFVVYAAGGAALWNARTGGHPGSSLSLQGDANLVVYSAAGSGLWASNTVNSTLVAGERLQAGWSLQSPDRHYRLLMQGDGNLVEYTAGGFAVWWTGTGGHSGASAVLQRDGNFVVYSVSGVALWNSRTGGHPGTRLSIQADVSIVVSNTASGVLWDSLPTNRKPPAGLADEEWNVLPTTQKVVALTFDAGANADAVASILSTLRQQGVHATFFLTGNFVKEYPAESKAIAAAGMRIGDHSISHPYFTQLTDTQMRWQVLGARDAIKSVTGAEVSPWFRFPYADRNEHTIATVDSVGFVPIGYTVDTLGWEGTSGGQTVQSVIDRVVAKLQPGEIVLMHCGSNPTDRSTLDAKALPT